MTKYKCIKKLVVPELEEYQGEATGKDFIVKVGEIFEKEKHEELLTNYDDGSWLQIEDDTLEEYFEEVETNQ